MQPQHEKKPRQAPLIDVEEAIELPWSLILYDDDIHTFQEVIGQLIKALECDIQTAEDITVTVHNTGSAVVFEGAFEECFRINAILTEIQLVTEIKG